MSQLPAMPMWWADFFSKTEHLSNTEQWAYAKLLAKTWLRNARPLPDDPRDLARVLDLTVPRWLKIRERIAPFFDLSGGTWRQSRLEHEYDFVQKRALRSRTNGAQGGRPVFHKNNGVENPAGYLEETQPQSTHTHTQKKKGSLSGAKAPTRDTRARRASFDEWWETYPEKVGKKAAEEKFAVALQKTSLEVLIAGVGRYRATKPEDRPWCNPARWLREERWHDEIAVPALVLENAVAEVPDKPEDVWRGRLAYHRKNDKWVSERWGPPPHDPACEAPFDLLVEFSHRQRERSA